MASIAIIVCTLDRPDALRGTLASIERSTIPVERVVVSDDGHDPRTELASRSSSLPITYAPGPRRGLGPNRNAGLRHVQEEFVLFLDDDCHLAPDFLERAIARMRHVESQTRRGSVIVSGAELNRGAVVEAAAQTFLGFQSRPYRPGEPMTSIVINACLFPAALFVEHQFDERIRYGYDEVDLASRAVSAGYTIVPCPDALNEHKPSPVGRAGQESFATAARLFVTFKRYAFTEQRYARAVAYLVIGPGHAVGSATRRNGVSGLRSSLTAVARAASYLSDYVAETRCRAGGRNRARNA
jgi:GT2 family glycosyltransferase